MNFMCIKKGFINIKLLCAQVSCKVKYLLTFILYYKYIFIILYIIIIIQHKKQSQNSFKQFYTHKIEFYQHKTTEKEKKHLK